MNREIKFRGKIKEKGMSESWIEGSLVHITKTYKGEEDEQECDIYQIINEDGAGFFIDKDTIGQYTGLKDKNGKEIYEGDIVKVFVIDDYTTGYVKYNEDKARFDIGLASEIEKYKNGDSFVGSCSTMSNEYDLLEVIGNIYDNPELLEV